MYTNVTWPFFYGRRDEMKDYTEISLFDVTDTFPDDGEISQKMIDRQLKRGSGFVNGRLRIYQWFQNDHTEIENQKFLSKEYGLGGWSTDFGWLDHDSKGLRFVKYDRINKHDIAEIGLSWVEVSKRIQTLIALDEYLTQEDKESLCATQEVESDLEDCELDL